MRGSAIAAAFALVITGVIIADVLTHPAGTAAAANGAATILKPTYNAVLGFATPAAQLG